MYPQQCCRNNTVGPCYEPATSLCHSFLPNTMDCPDDTNSCSPDNALFPTRAPSGGFPTTTPTWFPILSATEQELTPSDSPTIASIPA